MGKNTHIIGREACPYLPPAELTMNPSDSKNARGTEPYYLTTLACAQSLWLQGKPAQSLLQLNHALSVTENACAQWPLPYQAGVWILTRRHEEGFLGNPVRHYQHLASRVSGPNKELRSWRAWACFHLAESVLPGDEFPRDQRQIESEHLVIPQWCEVLDKIGQLGTAEETFLLKGLLHL